MCIRDRQGHLTNIKQSRVNSDAAQVLASSPKNVLKSTVFSCRRKVASDCSSLINNGREFQARTAATGNAQSPRVHRRVAGTISVDVAAGRRRLQELRLVMFAMRILDWENAKVVEYWLLAGLPALPTPAFSLDYP